MDGMGVVAILSIGIVAAVVGGIIGIWWLSSRLYERFVVRRKGTLRMSVLEAADLEASKLRNPHDYKDTVGGLARPKDAAGRSGTSKQLYRMAGDGGRAVTVKTSKNGGDEDDGVMMQYGQQQQHQQSQQPQQQSWFQRMVNKKNSIATLGGNTNRDSLLPPPKPAFNEMSVAALQRYGLNAQLPNSHGSPDANMQPYNHHQSAIQAAANGRTMASRQPLQPKAYPQQQQQQYGESHHHQQQQQRRSPPSPDRAYPPGNNSMTPSAAVSPSTSNIAIPSHLQQHHNSTETTTGHARNASTDSTATVRAPPPRFDSTSSTTRQVPPSTAFPSASASSRRPPAPERLDSSASSDSSNSSNSNHQPAIVFVPKQALPSIQVSPPTAAQTALLIQEAQQRIEMETVTSVSGDRLSWCSGDTRNTPNNPSFGGQSCSPVTGYLEAMTERSTASSMNWSWVPSVKVNLNHSNYSGGATAVAEAKKAERRVIVPPSKRNAAAAVPTPPPAPVELIEGLIGISTALHTPQTATEIDLYPGQTVVVLEAFSDGMGYGVNRTTGVAGFLPLRHVTFAKSDEMPEGVFVKIPVDDVKLWKGNRKHLVKRV
ncbi:hypothetical protein HDU97_002933 [Phlyctochytrium planicorne]|nr:hypothetical protein HDU97_002933 [Phlyctochytrium planicorne]